MDFEQGLFDRKTTQYLILTVYATSASLFNILSYLACHLIFLLNGNCETVSDVSDELLDVLFEWTNRRRLFHDVNYSTNDILDS